MTRSILIVLLSCLCLTLGLSRSANAAIAGASPSPAQRSFALNLPGSYPITWTVRRTGGPGPYTVESDRIDVRLGNGNGPVIYTISKSLSKTVDPPGAPNLFILTFSETVTLPRAILYQAAKAGQPLLLQRFFTDDNFNTVQVGEATATVTGSSSAGFSLLQMRLTFADGSTACAVDAGTPLTAMAELTTTGAGLLRGAWQVREGGNLGVYHTLRTVQAPVSAGQSVRLQSPPLPTGRGGERLDVRLAIATPEPGFAEPVISCAIGSNGKNGLGPRNDPVGPVAELLSPSSPGPLTAETELRWAAVPGAKAYRIEILPDADGRPLTAQLVKPDQTAARLSPLTLEKLKASKRYSVRVVAE